jgi:hypothetical protein
MTLASSALPFISGGKDLKPSRYRRLGLAQVRGIHLKVHNIVPVTAERAVGPGAYELALVA